MNWLGKLTEPAYAMLRIAAGFMFSFHGVQKIFGVLTTSQPAEQVIAGPETEVSADKTRATTRMFETVQDGVLQRSWCIIPGDPPGTYTYDITIDGEPRGEFVFCAIEVPNQDLNTDPRDLSCPNKFNSVQRAPKRPGSAS